MGWFHTYILDRWKRPVSGLEHGSRRQLEKKLRYRFRDDRLLSRALKHRSYVYANHGHGIDSNERLEFLGDAVLDLVVADFLFQRYPDRREGDLTEMKSLVVSRTVLARKAETAALGEHILLSPEERQAGGARQPSILSDVLEAIIGAVYLDGGLEAARSLVDELILDDFCELIEREDYTNYKSKLLEHAQSTASGHPRYSVHAEAGPDHRKVFSVEVSVNGQTLGQGEGRSKKAAQQMAARDALQRLGVI